MKECLFGAIMGLAAGWAVADAGKPIALALYAPEARQVCVRGSFDPWWQKCHAMKKNSQGRWSVVLDLPPGRYEFQFLVDGQWRYDPRLPTMEDSFGGRNNVLVIFP